MLSIAKEIVGENFHYYRKEAGLTQDELAGKARTGQRIVSKIENCKGDSSPSMPSNISDLISIVDKINNSK